MGKFKLGSVFKPSHKSAASHLPEQHAGAPEMAHEPKPPPPPPPPPPPVNVPHEPSKPNEAPLPNTANGSNPGGQPPPQISTPVPEHQQSQTPSSMPTPGPPPNHPPDTMPENPQNQSEHSHNQTQDFPPNSSNFDNQGGGDYEDQPRNRRPDYYDDDMSFQNYNPPPRRHGLSDALTDSLPNVISTSVGVAGDAFNSNLDFKHQQELQEQDNSFTLEQEKQEHQDELERMTVQAQLDHAGGGGGFSGNWGDGSAYLDGSDPSYDPSSDDPNSFPPDDPNSFSPNDDPSYPPPGNGFPPSSGFDSSLPGTDDGFQGGSSPTYNDPEGGHGGHYNDDFNDDRNGYDGGDGGGYDDARWQNSHPSDMY